MLYLFSPFTGFVSESFLLLPVFQIDTLLESFCEDNGLTINDALSGIKQMSDMPDIREVFQVSIFITTIADHWFCVQYELNFFSVATILCLE